MMIDYTEIISDEEKVKLRRKARWHSLDQLCIVVAFLMLGVGLAVTGMLFIGGSVELCVALLVTYIQLVTIQPWLLFPPVALILVAAGRGLYLLSHGA